MDRLINEIEKKFEESIDYQKPVDDTEVRYLIERAATAVCEKEYIPLEQKMEIVRYIFNRRRRYGILEPLLGDDEVSEIMINGANDIFYEKGGSIKRYESVFDSKETLVKIIRNMMLVANRTINEKNPIADARLAGGERICAILDNIAAEGPVLSIRKFSKKFITLEDLISIGSIDSELSGFLREIVKQRYNVIVSGGASCGKTTLLNVLSEFIDPAERVITIEDTLELNLRHVENIIKLEAREESLMIDSKKLLKTALRLRPDRIIVGEVRGKEAFYMLQAMNTGHDGSMSTLHANSSIDALGRLEAMVSSEFDIPVTSIRSYISSAVDILIHMRKTQEGGRVISQIVQLTGAGNDGYEAETLYVYQNGNYKREGSLAPKGYRC